MRWPSARSEFPAANSPQALVANSVSLQRCRAAESARSIAWAHMQRAWRSSVFFSKGECPMSRELIDTGTDKRFVRRDNEGKFKESDDVGRSLAQDQKRHSDNKPK